MKFLSLLMVLPALSHAAEWKQVWETKVPGAPAAAFYAAASGKIFVSSKMPKGEAGVFSLSDAGKLASEPVAEGEGEAGPLRSHADRIFWAVGKSVVSFPSEGGRKRTEAEGEAITDLAFNSKGELFVGSDSGLVRGKVKMLNSKVKGLFALGSELYVLNEGKFVFDVFNPDPKVEQICDGSCKGLERKPDGSWITVKGKQVISAGKKTSVLVSGATHPGKPAYVYRRESKDDLLVVPYPQEGTVRAYRAP